MVRNKNRSRNRGRNSDIKRSGFRRGSNKFTNDYKNRLSLDDSGSNYSGKADKRSQYNEDVVEPGFEKFKDPLQTNISSNCWSGDDELRGLSRYGNRCDRNRSYERNGRGHRRENTSNGRFRKFNSAQPSNNQLDRDFGGDGRRRISITDNSVNNGRNLCYENSNEKISSSQNVVPLIDIQTESSKNTKLSEVNLNTHKNNNAMNSTTPIKNPFKIKTETPISKEVEACKSSVENKCTENNVMAERKLNQSRSSSSSSSSSSTTSTSSSSTTSTSTTSESFEIYKKQLAHDSSEEDIVCLGKLEKKYEVDDNDDEDDLNKNETKDKSQISAKDNAENEEDIVVSKGNSQSEFSSRSTKCSNTNISTTDNLKSTNTTKANVQQKSIPENHSTENNIRRTKETTKATESSTSSSSTSSSSTSSSSTNSSSAHNTEDEQQTCNLNISLKGINAVRIRSKKTLDKTKSTSLLKDDADKNVTDAGVNKCSDQNSANKKTVKKSQQRTELMQCLICDKQGHTSFQCQMICANCSEPYHNHKTCTKPPNLTIMLQTFMEFCLKQAGSFNPAEGWSNKVAENNKDSSSSEEMADNTNSSSSTESESTVEETKLKNTKRKRKTILKNAKKLKIKSKPSVNISTGLTQNSTYAASAIPFLNAMPSYFNPLSVPAASTSAYFGQNPMFFMPPQGVFSPHTAFNFKR